MQSVDEGEPLEPEGNSSHVETATSSPAPDNGSSGDAEDRAAMHAYLDQLRRPTESQSSSSINYESLKLVRGSSGGGPSMADTTTGSVAYMNAAAAGA
eukprot:12924-Heterococcus_DN1.PRE.3